ncbi:MAG TPA: PPC domain-containing protein, partial [Pirellulaceae bacterium]|nr:PPC domain-containing protein [Pirellulaceae bacterium]
MKLPALLSLVAWLCIPAIACAEPPGISYIFPAGGRQGTELDVRVGGFYLHDQAAWEMQPAGVVASPQLTRTERLWFEGPLIRQPASQQKEDYPQDYTAHLKIAADAAPGMRSWYAWNGQGVTPSLKFVVGNLPEVMEVESDGLPLPTHVELPVTINGRIFPREDVDLWSFKAQAGQSITCNVAAESLGSPLEARLEILDAHGKQVAESGGQLQVDPAVQFTAPESGEYQVRICDRKFGGLQNHVYRLTITADAWVTAIFPLGGKRGHTAEVELSGQALPATKLALTWPDEEPGIIEHA